MQRRLMTDGFTSFFVQNVSQSGVVIRWILARDCVHTIQGDKGIMAKKTYTVREANLMIAHTKIRDVRDRIRELELEERRLEKQIENIMEGIEYEKEQEK